MSSHDALEGPFHSIAPSKVAVGRQFASGRRSRLRTPFGTSNEPSGIANLDSPERSAAEPGISFLFRLEEPSDAAAIHAVDLTAFPAAAPGGAPAGGGLSELAPAFAAFA